MLSRREYLTMSLEGLVRSDALQVAVDYVLSLDDDSTNSQHTASMATGNSKGSTSSAAASVATSVIQQDEIESFLLDLCGQHKRNEINEILKMYFTLPIDVPAESNETDVASTQGKYETAARDGSMKSEDILWPRPIGGSIPANMLKGSKTKGQNNDKSDKSKTMKPVMLLSKSSTKNQPINFDKIGVKKMKPKSNTNKTATNKTKHDDSIIFYRKCGCMATRHAYLGSCLSCGRIYCESEGPFPSIGNLVCYICEGSVLPPLSADKVTAVPELNIESTIKAYQLKDKLLMFDKENAKRTQVLDAQADYYESSTWLSEEEKKEIDEKERKRLEKYKVSNRRMRVAYDIAGRKFVHVEGSSDDEEPSNVKATCDPDGDRRDDQLSGLYRGINSDMCEVPGERMDSLEKELSNVTINYGHGHSVNNLSTESTKAGVVYRKLMERFL